MLSRRAFLTNASIAGGGLVLGTSLVGCGSEQEWPNRQAGVFQPNAFLSIAPDGTVTLTIHKAEMGQGVMTGLATLVAEELEVDPATMQFEFAEPHPDYVDPGTPMMITGGSTSIAYNFDRIREVGAAARQMLLTAAADLWDVPVDRCEARSGRVVLADGKRMKPYGELAPAAAGLPVPETVLLKSPGDWRLIGQYDDRVDAEAKTRGSAVFTLDVRLPGMLTAVLVRCPHFQGWLVDYDAGAAERIDGVRQVLAVNGAVAVLADTYWQARAGADALKVHWDKGPLAGLDSARVFEQMSRLLDDEQGRVVREDGEPPAEDAMGRTVEAEYRVPFLAHQTMEVMNAVASVTEDGAEIWAGNQAPDMLRNQVARMLDIPREKVTVHNPLLGGGFGRRAIMDFALEAVELSRITGKPVHVVWSREDDTRHDYYRPAAVSRFRARISDDGELLSWSNRIACPSIIAGLVPKFAEGMLPQWIPAGVVAPLTGFLRSRDQMAHEGASDIPYQIPHVRCEFLPWDGGVPVSFWRSVGHSQNAFFTECFVDEIAAAMGEDPLDFRLRRLPESARERAVLELAADRAGWGRAPSGRFQGLAVHKAFGSYVAEVAEISVSGGRVDVHRVTCAVDCGVVVNPDIVRTQVEGGVVYALSAALYGEITLTDGAVDQGNFHDQPMLRLADCPQVDVYLVDSEAEPTGIGEPGVPPLAPAVANAVFAATGERLRTMPLRLPGARTAAA